MSDSKPIEPAAEEPTRDTKATVADGQELTDADLAQVAGGVGDPHVKTSTRTSEITVKTTNEFIGH
jgi:hypothetical protein